MRPFIRPLFFVLFIFGFSLSGFSQEAENPLKVMTYNIWNGFDWGKDTTRQEKLIQWVKAQDPDVLALQELCDYTVDKLKIDAAKWGASLCSAFKGKRLSNCPYVQRTHYFD
ncbi:endonuclease/exonuclease/phosphatase family protein [Algoriphagus sp.]|uniref:endonuclease/exonuclease/phosphatase family protein n=1 Tax=Algoriphagus sp. TaxID=1872435 RepID=UPI0025DDA4C1|nr:endonuclease/exonuclease/phosphatase family protein [Algoriphagus sp.]